jgi:hypothetical protein
MGLSKFAGFRNAYDYAFGVNQQVSPLKVYSGGSAGSGTFSVTLDYGNVRAQDGSVVALTAAMPINLGTNTTNETVTPTTVSNPTPDILGTCTVTAAFSHAHGVGEEINSADGGLTPAQVAAAASGLNGAVVVDAAWGVAVGATLSHSGMNTAITSFTSAKTNVAVLDWSGFTGALSYTGTAGSALTSTTHVLY